MIKIFTGEDRVKGMAEIRKIFGEEYEVIEGENLRKDDLMSLFFGETLFSGGERKILVRDLGENKETFAELVEKIEEYVKTDAKVILFEGKIDKRTTAIKKLVKMGVEVKEFKLAEKTDMRAVFGIYDLALRDGKNAIKELEKIQDKQDPYMFFGLMVSQGLKKLEWKPNGMKEKKMIKALGELDIKMKFTGIDPWILIKSFLVKAATL